MMGGWIDLVHRSRTAIRASTSPTCRRTFPSSPQRERPPVAWRWYQNGYDLEPTDTGPASPRTSAYVSHHNGAQYFGYIANNPVEQMNLRGEGDFFADIANGALPDDWRASSTIRGGYYNLELSASRPPSSRTRTTRTPRA